MIRKLSLAVAVATALSPLGALALGLGEIHPQSALNQTFKADIDLLSVTQEELQDVRVSLASMEAFKKAGMDRPFHLTTLKFATQLTASGKPVISITSKDAIREPFLNFLVEVNWPKGRLVREFTVLLDPPVTLSRKPTPVAAPVARNQPVTKVIPSRRTKAPAAAMSEVTMSSGGGREYGPVQPNDNLWQIAKQMRTGGESIEQVMMALLDNNPSAFINSNVNNLKVGKILRLPEDADVTSMSKREAREEFLAQTREWQSGSRMAAPSEGGQQQPSSSAPTPQDRLKLVSPKAGSGESAEREGMAESEEIDRLQQEILLVRESNEGALQENSALKSRVQELEKQIQDIQRLLTLRSDELAQVQAAQSAASEQMEEMQPAAEPETPVAEAETVEEPVPAEQMEPAEPAVVEEGEPVAMEGEEPVVPVPEGTVIDEVDIEAKIDTAQSEMDTEQPAAADETPPAPVVEKPETKPVEAKTESPVAKMPQKKVGYFDGLKENSTMLAIVGGAGVVLIGLLILIMRRRKEAEAEFAESILVSPDSDIMPTGAEDSSSLTSPTDETSFMSDFSPSDIDALQDETGEVDPLSEADVYIAYGRYQQAEELINQAIEKYPDREELKHKLLEIYFSAKKSDEYSVLAQQLHDKGLPERQPDAWNKIMAMGKELNPGHALFAGAAGMAASDLSGDLDDLDLDLTPVVGSEEPAPAAPEEPQDAIADASDELESMDLSGLDNLDEMDSETLETDLSLDSEFLNKMEGVEEDATPMEDSDALDIDLSDLEVDSVPSSDIESKSTEEEPPPFDLSDIDDSQVVEVEGVDADSEALENLNLDSIEKELENISTDLDSDSSEVDELSLLHSHSENLDLDSTDEITTKLDLARAYIDMGDNEGAKSILEEVVGEGSETQQKEAQELLGSLTT